MSTPDLSGYVDVDERIRTFRAKHPEGSLQTELLELPEAFAGAFVAVRAYAYRSPEDPRPGVGLAWEPVPGLTPYTKNSELQNAETSAQGRAIVAALAADARTGESTDAGGMGGRCPHGAAPSRCRLCSKNEVAA